MVCPGAVRIYPHYPGTGLACGGPVELSGAGFTTGRVPGVIWTDHYRHNLTLTGFRRSIGGRQ
jgi:hypothetical protein